MTSKKNKQLNKGASIIETLFYVVIFVIVSIAVINAMIVMTKSFKETKVQREIAQASEILERISREIRGAYHIETLTGTNYLKLDTKDDAGANKTVEFNFTGNNISLLENSTVAGNLNGPNIKVQSLTFTQLTDPNGQALKIVLTIQAADDVQTRNFDFYDTVVLRGSY